MVFSNVIVNVTISRRSFVCGQSGAKVSAGFTNVRSLAVAAFDLVYCSLSVLRFVFVLDISNTFTAVHKDGIDDFHEHLNRQNADIQFTKEIEENGKIPFLDCLVTRDNNKLKTTIYRKPTHTDRLLDQSSYNPTSHKATTIRTLTRRAQLVCDSPDSLQDETDYLNNVFSKNNYNTDFVRRNTHSNTDSNTQTNVNSGLVTTATIPYIRGTSETIARTLQP